MPRLLTLGRFELLEDSTDRPVPIQPKRLALLAYLASSTIRTGSHRRDTLVGLFWPELAAEEARRALRHALHHLRRAVGDDGIVTSSDDQVAVNPAIVVSDAVTFDKAMTEDRYDDALAVYRGDFLQGVFVPEASPELEEWVDRTRARLRIQAVQAARHALASATEAGRHADAMAAAFRAHELAPDDEAVLRHLLRLMHDGGDRAGAIRLYEAFARRLHDEAGLGPEPATTTLVDELRHRPAPTVSTNALRSTSPMPLDSAVVATPAEANRTEASTATARRPARAAWIAAAVVMVAVIIGLSLRFSGNARSVMANSVAVIPFDKEGGDTTTAFFADGMTDELATALSRAGVHVAARTSVAALQSRHSSDAEVRRVLGVQTLLHGRVQRDGQRVRVWMQLVNGANGMALWTRSYDTTLTDIFGLQEDMARAIVTEIRPSLADSLTTSARAATGTHDIEAYELFAKGHFFLDRLETDRAIGALSQAVRRDSSYARAWALLARAYANSLLTGVTSRETRRALVRDAAERAVRLDASLADAYIARASALMSDWRFAEAEAALRRGIAIQPDNPDLYVEYCGLLFVEGRPNEALAIIQHVRELDPLSIAGIVLKQYVLLMLGRLDEARIETRRGLELDSTFVPLYQNAGIIEAFSGHPDSALALLRKGYELDPRMFGNLAYALFGYATAGRWSEVDRLRGDIAKERDENSPEFFNAVVATVRGDRVAAVTALERGFERHEPLFLFVSAACDPMFDALKSEPRYHALMRRYGMQMCPALGRWPIPRHS